MQVNHLDSMNFIIQEYGYAVIGSVKELKIGDVVPWLTLSLSGDKVDQPFRVIEIAGKEEFEEQVKSVNEQIHWSAIHEHAKLVPYFYKVITE